MRNVLLALGLCLLAVAPVRGADGRPDKSKATTREAVSDERRAQLAKEAEQFFASPAVVRLRLELSSEAMDTLRKDPHKYVHGTVWELPHKPEKRGKDKGGKKDEGDNDHPPEGAKKYADVGVHLKGGAGSFRPVDDKPALTLHFDEFDQDQRFHGLTKVHLNNSVQDPSYTTEILCGEMARAAGVPAPRGTIARVKLNDRDLGLYVVLEGFTKSFLRLYFENATGNLYDGGFLTDIDQNLQKIGGTGNEDVPDRADLKALVEASREPDKSKRWDRLSKLLDVDRHVSMIALEVFATHWDGYTEKANNYRVYHDPSRDKLIFFVHGMDQMFGDVNGSIFPDMAGMVSRGLIDTPEGRRLYVERMVELTDPKTGAFRAGPWGDRLDALYKQIKPALAECDEGAAREYKDRINGLKGILTDREKVVRRQTEEELKRQKAKDK